MVAVIALEVAGLFIAPAMLEVILQVITSEFASPVVAPTEWNFHPQGALREGLLGMAAHDAATLESAARRLVLALDPCVEYEIGIRRA